MTSVGIKVRQKWGSYYLRPRLNLGNTAAETRFVFQEQKNILQHRETFGAGLPTFGKK